MNKLQIFSTECEEEIISAQLILQRKNW